MDQRLVPLRQSSRLSIIGQISHMLKASVRKLILSEEEKQNKKKNIRDLELYTRSFLSSSAFSFNIRVA